MFFKGIVEMLHETPDQHRQNTMGHTIENQIA